MELNIQNETKAVYGVVLENNEDRYSSTDVEGDISTSKNGHTSTNISSTVSHHKVQTIWLKLADGRERAFRFDDIDIDVRVGHEVVIIYNRNNGRTERLINKSIRRYWSVGPAYPAGRRTVISLIYAGFFSLPYLSLLFSMTKWFDHVVSVRPKRFRVFRNTFSVCAVVLAISITAFFSPSVRDVIPEITIPISSNVQAVIAVPLEYVGYLYLYFTERDILTKVRDTRRSSLELDWYAEMTHVERAKYNFDLKGYSWQVLGDDTGAYKSIAIFTFLICVWTSFVLAMRQNKILSQYRQSLNKYCTQV